MTTPTDWYGDEVTSFVNSEDASSPYEGQTQSGHADRPFFPQRHVSILIHKKAYYEEDYPHSMCEILREFFYTAPLEIWHSTLCLSLGIWIGIIGYSTYDLNLYSPLLRYLSVSFFMFLFLGIGSGGIVGLICSSRRLRRTVAALSALLWGFAATYYLVGIHHPVGFPTCGIFAAQQMTVFVRLREIVL